MSLRPPPLSAFARNLRGEWRKLELPTNDKLFVAAVSGGADSSALLAALHELNHARKFDLRVVAAHFNHNLRGAESEADAKFVKNLAHKFNFNFVCENWSDTAETSNLKGNLEQAARRARYDFLFRAAQNLNAFAVLTAHTLNDQAETFLLRLIRGSGADGLGAMKSILHYENSMLLIRPMLSWARREMTEDYCRQRDIEFRHDRMNDDSQFSRVRVRHELLPLLAEFNPKIVETLAHTADLLREDAEQLNSFAAISLKDCQDAANALLPFAFCLLPSAVRRRVLRLWLGNVRGDLRRLEAKHYRAIEKLALTRRGGSFVELPNNGIVKYQNGRLAFESSKS